MAWRKTAFTELLSLPLPIIQAPMAGGPSNPELVAAVSSAGGMGSLAAGLLTPRQLSAAINDIKSKTSKPFSVNLFVETPPPRLRSSLPTPSEAEWKEIKARYVSKLDRYRADLNMDPSPPEGEGVAPKQGAAVLDEMLEILIKEKVAVVSYTFGVLDAAMAHRLRTEGNALAVLGTATSVDEARILIEEGSCDGVIAQGLEAGGHRGTFAEAIPTHATLIGLQSLLTTIRHLFDGGSNRAPIKTHAGKRPLLIAAGGIADGRGVLAALALGADAASLGSVFIPTVESGASDMHKDALVNPKGGVPQHTILSTAFTGRMARGLQNEFARGMNEFERIPPHLLGMDVRNATPQLNTRVIFAEASRQGRQDIAPLWAGQSAATLVGKSGKNAAEVLKEIHEEIDALVLTFAG
ncbi:nitronate monooxygenase [Synchytrium endobioticum]|uniref:Nitronate monooxygenase n=1 Tax=Synchytrium endobioticum TaxID=286115 RepID=A0A507CRT2_9FUNG|nr:nitronate monooxygenase [Synchytrium endobioticum]TPX42490.1 nitronate monooxygenase [Synchytrium endobioticum]